MSYELTAISDAENGSLTKTLSKDSLKQVSSETILPMVGRFNS
jgi:hypothetical protein